MEIKNQQGAALIEVIVSMILLAVLVTGINAGVLSLIKSNIASKELSSATSVGYQILEELRREPYGSLTGDNRIYHYKYACEWTVNGGTGTQKEILLTVGWPPPPEDEAPKHKIRLSTIIAEP